MHRTKGIVFMYRKSLLKLIRRIQQTTLKNIRKLIRPNSSSLYATASLEPFIKLSVDVHGAEHVGGLCERARCIELLLFHFPCACTRFVTLIRG